MGRVLIVLAAAWTAAVGTFLVLQVVQPPGCTTHDLLINRSGCGPAGGVMILHAVAGAGAGFLAVDGTVALLNRREARRRRP